MKKKLADEIRKAFVRIHCSHWYWHRESPLETGSFSRGVIVCNNCGKRKFIEQLKDSEVLVEPWRYKGDILEWLGKNCKDCGNEKCKKLGTLPKGHDCALWQPKVENHSIKMVTNAKEAENYPISEDISKSIEEINKLIFENGQAESEKK